MRSSAGRALRPQPPANTVPQSPQWPRALLALALLGYSGDSPVGSARTHPHAAIPTVSTAPSGWHDDFTTLDSTAWLPRNAGRRYLDAWNDPALIFARDGFLHVRVEERHGEHYTAQLEHRDLLERGTITARVRCPSVSGWWAAVWLQVDNASANGGLEVDLWECHRLMGDSALHAVHEYDTNGHVGAVQHAVRADPDDWHVVTVTLEPDEPIRFSMDGAQTVSPYVWPVNPVPVRVLVTGHVGSWAGVPNPTQWPDSALVDWITYTTK